MTKFADAFSTESLDYPRCQNMIIIIRLMASDYTSKCILIDSIRS